MSQSAKELQNGSEPGSLVACSRCAFSNLPGSRFCAGCGSEVGARATGRWPVERRQLTVLFCDLVGSTELASELDAEDLGEIILEYQNACVNVIEAQSGYVAQYLGDGIVAYFGFPRAHEDDAQRAVAAGLGLVTAVRGLRLPSSQLSGRKALSVRVGIHTGLVVTGQVGAGHHRELLALGQAPNVAARLQSAAAPNEVFIGETTASLVSEYFELEPVGTPQLKGISQPLQVFRAMGAGQAASRFERSVAKGLTPFQGRGAEIAVMEEALSAVRAGQPRALLLRGDSGVGKSRLVHRFISSCAQSVSQLIGHCAPSSQGRDFGPWVQILQQLVGASESESPSARYSKLQRAMGELTGAADERAAALALVMGLGDSPEVRHAPVAPDARRSSALGAAQELLQAYARRHPTILWIEDIQWMDSSSRQLLKSVLTSASGHRLLTILTESGQTQRERLELGVPVVPIAPLGASEARALVASVLGEGSVSPVVAELAAQSDGIPLYAEELAVTRLATAHDGPAWASIEAAIPLGLSGLLTASLDRLGEGKHVAQVASVFGREFSYDLLARVVDFASSKLDQGLRELCSLGLVRGSEVSDYRYAFKHVLIQQAAYSSLIKLDRRRYHGLVAEVLSSLSEPASARPDLVAHHLEEAGLGERAFEAWLVASRTSLERGAFDECLLNLERAEALLPELAANLRLESAVRLELLKGQASSFRFGYASAEAEAAYTRAFDLCQSLETTPSGDAARVLWPRLVCAKTFLSRTADHRGYTDKPLFWIIWGFGAFHQARGEHRKAAQLGERLLELSEGRARLELEGHFGAGSSYYFMGDLQRAQAHLQRGWPCYEAATREVVEASPTGHHAEIHCIEYNALVSWHRGSSRLALSEIERAEALALDPPRPFCTCSVLTTRCWLEYFMGNFPGALTAAEGAMALADKHGFGFQGSWARPIYHRAMLELHGDDVFLSGLRQTVDAYAARGERVGSSLFIAILAEALISRGFIDEALHALERANRLDPDGEEQFWRPELWRLQASALLINPMSRPQARELLKKSINLAMQQGNVALALRAAASLVTNFPSSEEIQSISNILCDLPPDVDVIELSALTIQLQQQTVAGLDP